MNKKYFFFWFAIIAICVTFFFACRKQPETVTVEVTDVMLNESEFVFVPGDTTTLIATVYPEDATNKAVIWTSCNTSVATVTDNGLVTAIADGKTTITVTTKDGNKKASCSVKVDGDYRAKWVGSYDCEVEMWSFKGKFNQQVIVNVYAREDIKLYLLANAVSQYTQGLKHIVKVNQDGSFISSSKAESLWGHFVNDSIYVTHYIASPSGNGVNFNYIGNKNQ